MFNYKDLKKEFNDNLVVNHYDALFQKFQITPSEQYIINKFVHKNSKILEIGCGTGRICINLAKDLYKNIIAIDIAKNMIKRTRKNMREQNVLFPTYTMSASRLKVLNMKFDAILFMYNGFCDIPQKSNREKTLKVIYDCLKKGGLFIFTTQDRDNNIENYKQFWEEEKEKYLSGKKKELGDLERIKFENVKTYVNVPTKTEIFELLNKVSFNIIFSDMTQRISKDMKKEIGNFRYYVCTK